MTVLSLSWLAVRPRRRGALIRRPGPARRERRMYRDAFFADPAAVEDDGRRMRRDGTPAR
jgi:hypothetical protein